MLQVNLRHLTCVTASEGVTPSQQPPEKLVCPSVPWQGQKVTGTSQVGLVGSQ